MKSFLIFLLVLSAFCANRVMASEADVQKVLDTCPESKNASEALSCKGHEADKLKKEMARLFRIKRDTARQNDKTYMEAGSMAFADSEKRLLKSQKLFEQYLATECERRNIAIACGAASCDQVASCEIDLVSDRIKVLNDSLY
jgi:uncharacterized protein YecT (DUF1311 family)